MHRLTFGSLICYPMNAGSVASQNVRKRGFVARYPQRFDEYLSYEKPENGR